MDNLLSGGEILFLWHSSDNLEANVNAIRSLSTVTSVKVENFQQITTATHANSTFDAVVTSTGDLPDNLIALALAKLKPQGRLVLLDTAALSDELNGRLVLGGFVNVRSVNSSVLGEKPKYETGSSATLSFGKKLAEQKAKVAAVWTIDNDDIDDDMNDEQIDADDLLDEEDRAKPDAASNRVCGTTGKRKACKDCSCGLADELAGEAPKVDPNQKSSCGSCYLGDAFRCGSCPYLGMPAFKPGEKIQLNENFLESA